MRISKKDKDDLLWLCSELIEAKQALQYRFTQPEFVERYKGICGTRINQLGNDLLKIEDIAFKIEN